LCFEGSLAYERINFFRKPIVTATSADPSSATLLGSGTSGPLAGEPPGPLVVGPVVVGPVVPPTKPVVVKGVLVSAELPVAAKKVPGIRSGLDKNAYGVSPANPGLMV
jgi:hypothetical protein